eukprot:m.125826 g.125826  ORF g.125826 m.125826 type:complete len:851 (-) comp13812_c0_seq4:122-2674(-)
MPRERCKYGSACYQSNRPHFKKYSHPCKHGSKCTDKTALHREMTTHDDIDEAHPTAARTTTAAASTKGGAAAVSSDASESDGGAPLAAAPSAAKKRAAKRSTSAARTSKTAKAKSGATSLKGKRVVFTGTFLSGTRKTVSAEASRSGVIVGGTVTKSTDYLVFGSASRAYGAKEDKAEALGIPILSEEKWDKMMRGGAVSDDDGDDSGDDSDDDDAGPAPKRSTATPAAKAKAKAKPARKPRAKAVPRATLTRAPSIRGLLDGLTVVFTGTFKKQDRDVVASLATKQGAIVGSGVSSLTDYVVVGDDTDGETTDQDRAKDFGVTVLTETDWHNKLSELQGKGGGAPSPTAASADGESDSMEPQSDGDIEVAGEEEGEDEGDVEDAAIPSTKASAISDLNLDLDGLKVVFTGTFVSGKRKDVEAAAAIVGVVVGNAVTSKTDVLVVGDMVQPHGSKEQKAKDLGTKVLSETQWLKVMASAEKDDADDGDDDDAAAPALPTPKNSLDDGESVPYTSASGSTYTIKKTGDHYYCTCPAWRNQSAPVNARTCKHLSEFLGPAYEKARVGHVKTMPLKAKGTPKPSLLLAHSWDETVDPTGWHMSEKLDGVRAYWDGKMLISRFGNQFAAPDWFLDALPTDFTLDGELFAGRGMFSSTTSIVRTVGSKKWNSITYKVFDSPSHGSKSFEERMELLTNWHSEADNADHIEIVEQVIAKDIQHVKDELVRVTETLGGEGLMLRKPKSTYAKGRSSTLLKVKRFYDAEAEVIGYEKGKGKHVGKMGALQVKMECGKTFKLGTGFSDAERATPPKIGAIVTYKFQELTDDGIPRFASFLRIRSDMSAPRDLIPKRPSKA